jgi:hypothetical protein
MNIRKGRRMNEEKLLRKIYKLYKKKYKKEESALRFMNICKHTMNTTKMLDTIKKLGG